MREALSQLLLLLSSSFLSSSFWSKVYIGYISHFLKWF